MLVFPTLMKQGTKSVWERKRVSGGMSRLWGKMRAEGGENATPIYKTGRGSCGMPIVRETKTTVNLRRWQEVDCPTVWTDER